MKISETRINQGGLMRCCIATILNYVDKHGDEEAPDQVIMDCEYEKPGNAQITLENGIWKWSGVPQVCSCKEPSGTPGHTVCRKCGKPVRW